MMRVLNDIFINQCSLEGPSIMKNRYDVPIICLQGPMWAPEVCEVAAQLRVYSDFIALALSHKVSLWCSLITFLERQLPQGWQVRATGLPFRMLERSGGGETDRATVSVYRRPAPAPDARRSLSALPPRSEAAASWRGPSLPRSVCAMGFEACTHPSAVYLCAYAHALMRETAQTLRFEFDWRRKGSKTRSLRWSDAFNVALRMF